MIIVQNKEETDLSVSRAISPVCDTDNHIAYPVDLGVPIGVGVNV